MDQIELCNGFSPFSYILVYISYINWDEDKNLTCLFLETVWERFLGTSAVVSPSAHLGRSWGTGSSRWRYMSSITERFSPFNSVRSAEVINIIICMGLDTRITKILIIYLFLRELKELGKLSNSQECILAISFPNCSLLYLELRF